MVEKGSDNNFFNSDGEYNRKEPADFREIVLRCIEKCRLEGSKEMIKGGEIIQEVNGQKVIVNVPDQRQVYIQCIKSLYDILLFYFDDPATKNIKSLVEKEGKVFESLLKDYIKAEGNEDLVKIAKETGLLPESPFREPILQAVENQKLDLWRLIYQELVLLFKRRNDLSKKRKVED